MKCLFDTAPDIQLCWWAVLSTY